MTRILLLFLIVLPLAAFSQGRINFTKAQVKEDMKRYSTGKDSIQVVLKETDSTLEYSLRAPELMPTDLAFFFDKKDKCRMEKVIVFCDTCLVQYLQPILDKKEYGWQKINENQYISSYPKKLLLELPLGENDRSFIILRTDWSQKLYDILTGKDAGN